MKAIELRSVRSCLACGATDLETAFTTRDLRHGLLGEFTIQVCNACGSGATDPAVADPSLAYPETYQNHGRRESFPDRLFRAAVRRTATQPRTWVGRLILRAVPAADVGAPLPHGARLLDVGAGSGHAVSAFRAAGIDAWGLEPSERAVKGAHEAGFPFIRRGTLLDRPYPREKWDVIRFWHTLEHAPSPLDDLREAKRILRAGGRIVIGVPNFSGAGSRLFRENWDGLEVPRHFVHFTPNGLRSILARGAFSGAAVRTVAIMGVFPASLSHKTGKHWLAAGLAQLLFHPAEIVLSLIHRGDGLLAFASADVDSMEATTGSAPGDLELQGRSARGSASALAETDSPDPLKGSG